MTTVLSEVSTTEWNVHISYPEPRSPQWDPGGTWKASGTRQSLSERSDWTRVFRAKRVRLTPAVHCPQVMTNGWETVDMTLRRNGLGQLGFHVKYDGTVAEVEDYGFAWQAGLRQGSRLVEICKVAVVTLSHDQMIDLLRTSVTVKVVIIPPFEDGTPRR